MKSALIVVDVQKDFCEGGLLGVPGGKRVAERIGNYIEHMGGFYDEIVVTSDNHEPWPKTNGGHFSDNPDFINTWPPHCQVGTEGIELMPEVQSAVMEWMIKVNDREKPGVPVYRQFRKGLGYPDYSGFQGHNYSGIALNTFLLIRGVTDVDVVGIAGDYCVKATALDAKKYGYITNILPSLVASVGGPEATQEAIHALDNL